MASATPVPIFLYIAIVLSVLCSRV